MQFSEGGRQPTAKHWQKCYSAAQAKEYQPYLKHTSIKAECNHYTEAIRYLQLPATKYSPLSAGRKKQLPHSI
jgi:hypothetical protein